MFKHPSSALVGMVLLSFFLAGCSRTAHVPDVIGAEGQSGARAAFEQMLEALDSGNQDKVWEGLSAQSQSRIKKGNAREGAAETRDANPSDKAQAVSVLRGIVGRKAKIKDVRGTRSGVEVEVEYAAGKSRDLEMVLEGGAWKLNLFSS